MRTNLNQFESVTRKVDTQAVGFVVGTSYGLQVQRLYLHRGEPSSYEPANHKPQISTEGMGGDCGSNSAGNCLAGNSAGNDAVAISGRMLAGLSRRRRLWQRDRIGQ